MKLTRDLAGISKMILILLLLISFIAGALFSYVYTMGYYAPSEFRIPEKPAVTIQSVEFSKQDTRFFDVTVLNPSYSPSDVNITRIEARTLDGNKFHLVTGSVPETPFVLQRGHSQTFRAYWNWANYTGIELPYANVAVEISVFAEDGLGASMVLDRPLTELVITNLELNQSISVNRFNVTLQNMESSATFVNITAFIIDGDTVPTDKITPKLPYVLNPGTSQSFQCVYNWTALIGKSPTLSVSTLQGYIAQKTHPLLSPVDIEVSQLAFNATVSTTQFNATVTNHEDSSTYVDIDRITVVVGEEAPVNITDTTPSLPLRLPKNTSTVIICTWTWSTYSGQAKVAKVTVYTSQGFVISKEIQIP